MFMTASIVPIVEPDPVPTELRAVVELFAGELAKVTFPDVDATVLARELDAVRARSRDVDKARAALAAAERALDERTAALAQLAARGIAYARIYAAAHPELTGLEARLASLTASAAGPRADGPAIDPAPRRRGRPPRSARTELPFDRDDHADPGAAEPARGAAMPLS
jgi:hypothetical protein